MSPPPKKRSYTMRDVARLAGVSVATVSAVVNGKQVVRPVVVARVQDAMKALNFHPDHVARSLRVKKTTTIGVVVPDFSSGFFVDVLRGIEDAARNVGYSVLLCNSDDDVEQEQRHLKALLSRRVDGILLASTDLYSIADTQLRSGTPIVLFDRVPPGYRGAAVVVDNVDASYRATRHLIDLGHRSVAFIAGRLDLSTASDRAEGFRRALEDAHLPLNGAYFRRGDFHPESGYQNGLELLRLQNRPTAIVCSNGVMTLGLLRAIHEQHVRCPEEISIIGFDEPAPDSYGFNLSTLLRPELTVVAQPGYEVGKQSAQTLLRLVSEDHEPPADQNPLITLQAELRVRKSTAAPSSQTPTQ
ncbi:MAG TPA: LacI family DNA-binding transcriptional regulator [Candidatus Sulfotelmatobacter sp.]|nr:LacI family DNA-binding transcriptional regulator [Candidatus Sulfotelmatobacter sp.]